MIHIQHNMSLTSENTLAIAAVARFYTLVDDVKQIPDVVAFAHQHNVPMLVLGGGSNIVLTQNFPGLVIKMALTGIEFNNIDDSENNSVHVTAAAGENWNNFVQTCLAHQYYGLENLSLIPGSVGAAPIQNIGAYGVELNQVFESLTGWNCDLSCWQTLTRQECEFAYRDSIFKHYLKDKFIITSVSLILSRNPSVDTSYGVLLDELKKQGITEAEITPQSVAEAVIAVRQSKLPDPSNMANVGSFFKNPTISNDQFQQVHKKYPSIIYYPQENGQIKLAAGWMLEQAGWKGKKLGSVGMHLAQSLVLINYGGASGCDVLNLAKQIQQDIFKKFTVKLDIEPAIYPIEQ